MLRKTITINNKLGLHARASMQWTKLARCFISEVTLEHNGKQVDGKSILEVMALAVRKGAPVQVIVRGEDEATALTRLEQLVRNKFGEEG